MAQKCIYCLSTTNTFLRREHPIPESLGNDDIVLPSGFVCDPCNQYFGSKVEQEILQTAPFGVERAFQSVKTKKGKHAHISGKHLSIQSLGAWDTVEIRSDHPHPNLHTCPDGMMYLNPKWARPDMLVRFLIKMGIGLLGITEEIDPYSAQFDKARQCARFGRSAGDWDFALGLYPRRSDLLISTRFDHIGRLETRQIYQYGIGKMASGDVVFSFVYATSCFAVCLSRPHITEYILGFNMTNSFTMESRYRVFRRE